MLATVIYVNLLIVYEKGQAFVANFSDTAACLNVTNGQKEVNELNVLHVLHFLKSASTLL